MQSSSGQLTNSSSNEYTSEFQQQASEPLIDRSDFDNSKAPQNINVPDFDYDLEVAKLLHSQMNGVSI